LCDVVGHATNNCLELPHVKNVVSDTFLDSNIPEVHVTLIELAKKKTSLHTNQPCALCDNYGHYFHLCPCIEDFHGTLQVLRELEFARSDSTSPLPADFGPTPTPKHEVSQPPIVIPFPDVEMTDSIGTILYLLSSMRSMHWNSLDVSYCDFVEPSLTNTLVSTMVDTPSTSHMSPKLDDMYVNIFSHEDASCSSSSSCGISFSNHPIFHSDESMMEAMTTPYYPWDDMHHRAYFLPQQTHEQYVVESKDFIHGEVDWFRNPIPTLDSFEEGNMVNISPTIKINISNKAGIEMNIILGEQCTPKEIDAYAKLFKELCDVFAWSYYEIPELDPTIVEHHIDTWLDAILVCQKKRPIHPSKRETIKAKIDNLK